MPRKKATAPAAETEAKKAEEVKAEETVKAAPAKKTTTRKTAAKKAAPKAEEVKAVETVEEAPVVAEAAPVAATAEVFIEFGGAQVPVSEIIKNAQNVVGADKNIKVYVQPENSKAYIAFDDQSVEMDVYFVQ